VPCVWRVAIFARAILGHMSVTEHVDDFIAVEMTALEQYGRLAPMARRGSMASRMSRRSQPCARQNLRSARLGVISVLACG